jgi:hypothetical protein
MSWRVARWFAPAKLPKSLPGLMGIFRSWSVPELDYSYPPEAVLEWLAQCPGRYGGGGGPRAATGLAVGLCCWPMPPHPGRVPQGRGGSVRVSRTRRRRPRRAAAGPDSLASCAA